MIADPARKLHVPSEWEAAAAEIFERRLRMILVIGGSAVGKSSFCRYLADALLARQAEVAFVDADIGQSNLGPPATVTLGYPTSPVDFSAMSPVGYYFVGSTGPMGRFLPLVIGTASLAGEARGAFVIIDTTGLVHESVESSKATRSKPFGRTSSSPSRGEASLRRSGWPIGTCPSSGSSLRARRTARTIAKGSKCGGGPMRGILPARHRWSSHSSSLIFQRTLLFAGKPIELEGAVHAESSSEGILIVGAPVAPPPDSKLLPAGFERNLLSGLADLTGHCLGLGIIERIDFATRTIALTTVVERDKIRIVQFGDLYVTREGGELGQVKWAW